MNKRIEYDLIGSLEIPVSAYYGIQSLRAKNNFNISGRKMNPQFIISLAEIKKAAALTNRKYNNLNKDISHAIILACDEIIHGKLHDQFIVDPIQGGAGTSANMNINEVVANRAIEILGGEKGNYDIVNPNDHVNMCQSTNDVFPTAGKITAIKMIHQVILQLERLYNALIAKSFAFENILKMGRTQLQDAVPVRLGQCFNAYATMVSRDIDRLIKSLDEMKTVNLGATAIGTSINAPLSYVKNIVPTLKTVVNLDLKQARDLIDATQNIDCFVAVSGILKTCVVNLSKMCNDLRLLSSGPKTGIGEINLPAKQNGSSIMPGKINPVIPEVVSQVAFNVIGNDLTITMAAEAGQLELNAFEPILFYNLFESLETLSHAISTLVDNCIIGITANEDHCLELLEESVGIATALCPYIGYKKSAEIAKSSLKTGIPIRKLVLKNGILTKEKLDSILNPATMTNPKYISAS